jgi:hypothetical protein
MSVARPNQQSLAQEVIGLLLLCALADPAASCKPAGCEDKEFY